MIRSGTFNADEHKKDYESRKNFKLKADLIKHHFKKIQVSDAILVVNEKKHGYDGYIGGNVLMEMALAFHLKKPIYILNPVSETLPHYSEVMGMLPVFLGGNIHQLIDKRS